MHCSLRTFEAARRARRHSPSPDDKMPRGSPDWLRTKRRKTSHSEVLHAGELIASQSKRIVLHLANMFQDDGMDQGPDLWRLLALGTGLSESAVRNIAVNRDTSEPVGRGSNQRGKTALPCPVATEDSDLQAVLKEFTAGVIAQGHKDGRPLTSHDIYEAVSNIVRWDKITVTHKMFRTWMSKTDFFYARHDVGSPVKAAHEQLANIVQTKGFLDEVCPLINEGYVLVYDDESYLQNSHARCHSWYHRDCDETAFVRAKGYKGDRWCFQAVLSPDGVVPGTYQKFKGGSGQDYHASFDGARYYDWFVSMALPSLAKAYPNRKIVWVTDSAAYHKVTRLALNNASAPGRTPTSKKDYAAACKALGCDVEGKRMRELKDWVFENYHDVPVLTDVAHNAGVELLYQPPSFSECNAIELIWAWVKNKIAMDHPPSTRTFAELGAILDGEMNNVTFAVRGGEITKPKRKVDVAGLYKSTTDLYRSQLDRVEKFLESDLNKLRFAALDARLDQGRRPKAAEKEVRNEYPSPVKPCPNSSAMA